MKELSIEEKAKAYDKAIEKLRSLHDNYDTVSLLIDVKEELEDIFPELRESEDERIRKAMINGFKDYKGWDEEWFDGITVREAIAWLEKQGENPTTLPKWKYKKDNTPLLRDSIILNKYGCVAKSPSGALVSDVWVLNYDELAKLPKEELEKKDEQKPADKVEPDILIEESYQQQADDLIDMVTEKTAWSEEDAVMLNKLLAVVKLYYDRSGNDLDKQSCISFLKSLKDRVQPKQEWSDEDENTIQVLKYIVRRSNEINENIYTMPLKEKLYNWLKSIRPQNRWKPSETDIKILEDVICGLVKPIKYHATLYAILEQLKKLKEE